MSLTQVVLTLDNPALQTVKMGLAALSLNAQALDAAIDAQVQAQLIAASKEADDKVPSAPLAKKLNGDQHATD